MANPLAELLMRMGAGNPNMGAAMGRFMPGQNAPRGLPMGQPRTANPFQEALGKPPASRSAQDWVTIEREMQKPKRMAEEAEMMHRAQEKVLKARQKREAAGGQ